MDENVTGAQIVPTLPVIGLEWSASCANIAQALAAAQGELENVVKDATNPHFRAKYANLAGIVVEVRPKLAKQSIAVIQSPYNDGEDVGIETVFMHKSGEWLRGRLKVKPVKYDAQGVGSVLTYLRRYTVAAMAGVAPEDDDGEGAMGRPSQSQQTPAKPTASKPAHQGPKAAETAKPWQKWLDGMLHNLPQLDTAKALNTFLLNENEKIEQLKDAAPEDANKLQDAIEAAMERVNMTKAG